MILAIIYFVDPENAAVKRQTAPKHLNFEGVAERKVGSVMALKVSLELLQITRGKVDCNVWHFGALFFGENDLFLNK